MAESTLTKISTNLINVTEHSTLNCNCRLQCALCISGFNYLQNAYIEKERNYFNEIKEKQNKRQEIYPSQEIHIYFICVKIFLKMQCFFISAKAFIHQTNLKPFYRGPKYIKNLICLFHFYLKKNYQKYIFLIFKVISLDFSMKGVFDTFALNR